MRSYTKFNTNLLLIIGILSNTDFHIHAYNVVITPIHHLLWVLRRVHTIWNEHIPISNLNWYSNHFLHHTFSWDRFLNNVWQLFISTPQGKCPWLRLVMETFPDEMLPRTQKRRSQSRKSWKNWLLLHYVGGSQRSKNVVKEGMKGEHNLDETICWAKCKHPQCNQFILLNLCLAEVWLIDPMQPDTAWFLVNVTFREWVLSGHIWECLRHVQTELKTARIR